jgi:hypothetical protein
MLGQRDQNSRSHGCYSLHAVPSRQEQYATSRGTDLASRFGSLVHYHALAPHSFGVDNRSKSGTLFQFETRVHGAVHFARGSSARGFAVSFLVRQSVALCGVRLSWVHYRGRSARRLPIAITRSPKLANDRSVSIQRFFPQSPECFGRTRQRPILRPRPIVRCAPPKCISLEIGIGQAMLSPRSSEKSSSVTA